MKQPRRHSNTDRVVDAILLVLLIGATIFCIITYTLYKTQKNWTEEYPMTNQHIEWTGAGYQPLWQNEEP